MKITRDGLIVLGSYVHGRIHPIAGSSTSSDAEKWEAFSMDDGTAVRGTMKRETALCLVMHNRDELTYSPPAIKSNESSPSLSSLDSAHVNQSFER